MSNVAKLKKQAAELELKKQFDKAIAVYVKLLESFDQHADELDVGLFNRVGDLMLRQGNVADAVDYYEQAVDRYADTGFFNNAIALCNKILRHSPGRATVYYKLGRISAQKGFKNDAKVNFLEYADRMQKGGKIDEAFRALKEFADLCPDQDDIRLMLADQLTKADRKDEAVEQLQTLYERYDSEGRSAEAVATAERMRAIDPSVEPRAGGGTQKSTSGDLIFLDLDAPTPAPRPSVVSKPAPAAPRPSAPVASPPSAPASAPTPAAAPAYTPPRASTPADVAPIEHGAAIQQNIDAPLTATPDAGTPLAGITRVDDGAADFEKTPSQSLLGLESTRLADDDLIRQTPSSSLLDVEPTSLIEQPPEPVYRSSRPTHAMTEEDAAPEGGELEFILPEPEEAKPERRVSIEFDASTLTTPPESAEPAEPADVPRPPRSRETPDTSRAALDGLPLMDIEVPVAPTPAPTPRVSRPLEELSLDEDLELVPEHAEEAAAADFIDLDAESLVADDEPIVVPTPSVARRSTMVAVQSVEILKASVEGEPENWSLRRELGEAMLEAGDREGGIRELENAMAGAERSGDLELASSLAEEIARLEPEAVKHHQKRVEYAFRTNDRGRLIEAYLALGDALLGSDQADKARTVYQRVLDLAPDEIRARTALDAIVVPEPEPAPPPPPRASGTRRSTIAMPMPVAPPPAAAPSDFVNLGDWLRDDEGPKDTRMVVAEQEPTGDEEADFADMLRKFKQGVAENVDPEDYQSHYDLAIAYKEMGLLDEAVSEFQKALGSPVNRLPTYEALGQCFIDKEQYKLASSILSRALTERASEDQLVGVLYLLGRAAEAQGNPDDALMYYQRVFVVDIQFRDIAERMNELERAVR